MGKSKYAMVLVPAVSLLMALALPASAQQPIGGQQKGPPAKGAPQKTGPVQRGPAVGARPITGQQGVRQGSQQGYRQGQQQGYRAGQQGYRTGGAGVAGRGIRAERRAWGGRAYYGRTAWNRGTWRHEMRNGRMGWWWDVGGAWYFYEQPVYPYPTMISDVEVLDDPDAAGGPPPDEAAGPVEAYPPGAYPPPPGAYYPPPPAVYVPPPVVCVGPLCIR
jgi:hypothetical protein